MLISDWSSDVCSSDLAVQDRETGQVRLPRRAGAGAEPTGPADGRALQIQGQAAGPSADRQREAGAPEGRPVAQPHRRRAAGSAAAAGRLLVDGQGGTRPPELRAGSPRWGLGRRHPLTAGRKAYGSTCARLVPSIIAAITHHSIYPSQP